MEKPHVHITVKIRKAPFKRHRVEIWSGSRYIGGTAGIVEVCLADFGVRRQEKVYIISVTDDVMPQVKIYADRVKGCIPPPRRRRRSMKGRL